jgi:transposase
MIALPPGVCVYLACGVPDMRKGMAGLAMLVQQGLDEAPFNGTTERVNDFETAAVSI